MTSGSSQGLFVIVAVVIFGIFVVISYLLFRDKLQTGLASIFTDSITESQPIDFYFNNNIREVEYNSGYEFINRNNNAEWNLSPLYEAFGENQVYTLTFELKSEKSGSIQIYTQNGSTQQYKFEKYAYITSTTEYKKYAITFKLIKSNPTENFSSLSFYGNYDSGNIPTIKNVRIDKGNVLSSLDSSYTKVDYYK